MKKDISYIIKRVIIGVAIALIIMFLKSNVFAQNCSGTKSYGYRISTTWTNNVSSDEVLNRVPNEYYIRTTDSNISNSVIAYSDSFTYKVFGVTKDQVNPTIKVKYGTTSNSVDVTSNCSVNINKVYESAEYPNNFVDVGVAISCNFTGDNSSANMIQVSVTTLATGSPEFSRVFQFHATRSCLTLLPNDYDRIINSLGLNRIELQNFIQNTNEESLRELLDLISSESINLQDVINQANETLIDSQQVCDYTTINDIEEDNKYISSTNGSISSSNSFGISKYYQILNSTIKKVAITTSGTYACFYKKDKSLISCYKENVGEYDGINTIINIPENAYYFRFSIFKQSNRPQYEICTLSSQALADTINKMYKYTSDSGGITTDSNNNLCIGNHCIDISQFGPLPKLLTMPRIFLNDVRDALHYESESLRILKNDLPFYSKGIYRNVSFNDGYFELPPLKNLFIRGDEDLDYWYEWLGTILGGILLFVYFIHKGRIIMKMGRLGNTDNESWGGIE